MNDVLELYAQYPARTQDALRAEARERGVALGLQVNRVARAGPAVLLVTAPDLGLAPFGAAETAAAEAGLDPVAVAEHASAAVAEGATPAELVGPVVNQPDPRP